MRKNSEFQPCELKTNCTNCPLVQGEIASKKNLVSSISQPEIFGHNSHTKNKFQPSTTQAKVRVEKFWDFKIFLFLKNILATWAYNKATLRKDLAIFIKVR